MSTQSVNSSNWDWNHSSQSRDCIVKIKNKFLDKCLDNTSNWRRLTGLPIGVVRSSLFVAECVALIGEQTIKGVGNLFGALIPGSKFSAKKGAKQLLLVPLNIVKLALSPIGIAFNIALLPLATAINPDWVKKGRSLTRDEIKLLRF